MTPFNQMSPEVDAARRIAFTIAMAAARLGITQTKLPTGDVLHAILEEAAMRPADIDPAVYAMVYRLHSIPSHAEALG